MKATDTSMSNMTDQDKFRKAYKLITVDIAKGQNLTQEASEQKLEEAFRLLSHVCQRDETAHEAFGLRARCNYHFGDFQRALYDYSVAIRLCEAAALKEPHSDKYKRKLGEYYNYAGV